VSPSNRKPYNAPDDGGHFGEFGGRFVAETLTHALDELTELYENLSTDEAFRQRFEHDLAHYVGRPISFVSRRASYNGVGLPT
jgi:tryptophan synthase beta chain